MTLSSVIESGEPVPVMPQFNREETAKDSLEKLGSFVEE
jgi:hypothetical protein